MFSCPRCGEKRSASEFTIRKSGKHAGRRNSYCKPCVRKASAKWRRENPDKYKEMNARWRKFWLKKYGLTEEMFDEMLEKQEGRCAICRRIGNGSVRFHVDHDHSSGFVRGLLCTSCNQGLGSFKDNPDFMLSAIEYLRSRKVITV